MSGVDEVVGQIALFRDISSGACKISTHFAGNVQYLALGADQARTETNTFAFLVRPTEQIDRVAMRSLRYIDRWRREGATWKIADRLHTLDWSSHVDADFAMAASRRIPAVSFHCDTEAVPRKTSS